MDKASYDVAGCHGYAGKQLYKVRRRHQMEWLVMHIRNAAKLCGGSNSRTVSAAYSILQQTLNDCTQLREGAATVQKRKSAKDCESSNRC
eukprot:1599712-Pleurochrysis_carterae.AAC.2